MMKKPPSVPDLRVGCDQIEGTHHPQEDSFGYGETPYGYYYVLADGMGGYGGGDIAGQTVIDVFSKHMEAGDSPDAALAHANRALAVIKEREHLPAGAGCTLVAVAVDVTKEGTFCSFLSVGDSYIFYCPAGGPMRQVNPLHENEDGSLYSALQGADIEEVYSAQNAIELHPGDRLMLASDGFLSYGENRLKQLFHRYPVPPLQHRESDVIPGEAGDLVFRILRRLEEYTEQGLHADPEYYQDNTTVLIVEWAPAAQTEEKKGIKINVPGRISRERLLFGGVIVFLLVALCLALIPGADSEDEPRSVVPGSSGTGDNSAAKSIDTFKNILKNSPRDYSVIVGAWKNLDNQDKDTLTDELAKWFYDDGSAEKFEQLMERCKNLAAISDDNLTAADEMLRSVMLSKYDTIAGLLPQKINEDRLSLRLDDSNIPHFRWLDLLLASKAIDEQGNVAWLDWFIYDFSYPGGKPDKLVTLQKEVRTKARSVDPDKLKNAFIEKDDSAFKRNVVELMKDRDFIAQYSHAHQEWIKGNYNNKDAENFCQPLMSFLIEEYKNDAANLRGLGMNVENLGRFGNAGVTAKTTLAAADLASELEDLNRKNKSADLGKIENAYEVAANNKVEDYDKKVFEGLKIDAVKSSIYKDDRYLKPIWTNLLIRHVSQKKDDAGFLSGMGLDPDKICKLLDKKPDNDDLKTALKTLIKKKMPEAKYKAFKKLHSIAKEKIDQAFAAALVWQFFTNEGKLNAKRVTEYAEDATYDLNHELMDVLVDTLIKEKAGDSVSSIDVGQLIDFNDVEYDCLKTGWKENANPGSWLVYRYVLFCMSQGRYEEMLLKKGVKADELSRRRGDVQEELKELKELKKELYLKFIEKIKIEKNN